MPVATLTSKGQMTIPKEVRKALNLKPFKKVILFVDGNQAVIKPLRGNILDICGSIRIPDKEMPISFRKVREETKERVAEGPGSCRLRNIGVFINSCTYNLLSTATLFDVVGVV